MNQRHPSSREAVASAVHLDQAWSIICQHHLAGETIRKLLKLTAGCIPKGDPEFLEFYLRYFSHTIGENSGRPGASQPSPSNLGVGGTVGDAQCIQTSLEVLRCEPALAGPLGKNGE